MKTFAFLATILCASGAFGQGLSYIPKPAAIFYSADGSGASGTWNPAAGGSGTSLLYSPAPMGAYCSSDGTGNAGTWKPCPATNATAASCLAATIVTAPCVAFQGAFTALGVSGTTGTLTLYTANAPANATFQICPNTTINTAGTAGLVALEATFTTPGGTVRNPSVLLSTALTAAGNQIGSCASLTMAANSTFSFLVLASAGTGTPVWETEPVVLRIH